MQCERVPTLWAGLPRAGRCPSQASCSEGPGNVQCLVTVRQSWPHGLRWHEPMASVDLWKRMARGGRGQLWDHVVVLGRLSAWEGLRDMGTAGAC